MPTSRDEILERLADTFDCGTAGANEARAEQMLQEYERQFICPRCGQPTDSKPVHVYLDPESVAMRTH